MRIKRSVTHQLSLTALFVFGTDFLKSTYFYTDR